MAKDFIKQKLELNWIGKFNPDYDIANIEPRILEEKTELSFGDKNTQNMIIHGDNLLALKALLPDYEGKIKCVYIDPPYNTGNAFDHYDDSVEHSTWLSLMKPRLQILKALLSKNGLLFLQLDDNEVHYAKVLCDEVFGRSNYLNQVSIKMKQTSGASGGGEDKKLKKNLEYILIYANNREGEGGFQSFNEVYDEEDLFEVIEEMRSTGKSWKYTRILKNIGQREYLTTIKDGSGDPIKIYQHSGVEMVPISQVAAAEKISERDCYFKYFDKIFRDTNAQSSIRTRVLETVRGKGEFFSIDYIPRSGRNKGNEVTLYYKGTNCDLIAWLKDVAVKKGTRLVKLEKAGTYWDGFPLNNLTKEGNVLFPQGKKPEALLQKIVELSTDSNDFILDSFLGSGTTAAVAHKMNRKFIGIEMRDQAYSHVHKRLVSVVDGTDQSGISKAVSWKGGGGFKFYELAPSFVTIDEFGNPVIDPFYNDSKLIRAMCKLTNFTFSPSSTDYWKQGKGQENSSIYVTTQMLSVAMVQQIARHLKINDSLLICPKKFEPGCEKVDNRITIKKIPQSVLRACHFGKKEYLLPIKDQATEEINDEERADDQE